MITTSPQYRHTQVGWTILGAVLPIGAIAAWYFHRMGAGGPAALSLGILALTALLFGALTVTVDQEKVKAAFGLGLIRKTIDIQEVHAVHIVKTPWHVGWGVRMIPGGMIYNVSGFHSLEFHMKSGRKYRIGTDDPAAFHDAVRMALQHQKNTSNKIENMAPGKVPQPPTARNALGRPRLGSKARIIVVVIVIMTVMGFLIQTQSQPPKVAVSPEKFCIKSLFYGAEIPWTSIRKLSMEDEMPRIETRTNGFAIGPKLRGHFRLESQSKAQIFVQADAPPFILIRTDSGFLFLNDQKAANTRALFASMQEAWIKATAPK